MNKREDWIDYVKAISIIFIVCGHAGYHTHMASYYHVAIFFIISGYFFKDKKIIPFIKSKIKRLYVPFLISNIIYIFSRNILYYLGATTKFYTIKEIFPRIINVLKFNVSDTLGSSSWFLFALFITSIEFLFLFKLSSLFKKNSKLVLGIICITLFIIGIYNIDILNTFSWGNCSIVSMLFIKMIFMYIGYMIKEKNVKHYLDKKENIQILLIAISVIILMLAKYVFNYSVDYRSMKFNNTTLFLILPVCGFIFLSFIPTKIIDSYKITKKIFSYIGKNTIEIMLYHILCFQIVSFFQIHFGNFEVYQLNNWLNFVRVDNWRFLAIILGISVPILFKFLIDQLKKVKINKLIYKKKRLNYTK